MIKRRFLIVAVLLAGGCCAVPREAADALAEGWGIIQPFAAAGIEADASLTEEQKVTFRRHAQEFGLTVEALKKNAR